MNDLTITQLCFEAISGIKTPRWGLQLFQIEGVTYDPLHDDAQAMALVKRFDVKITKTPKYETWRTVAYSEDNYFLSATTNKDLNRAICETIAKMQQEKAQSSPA